MRSGDITRWLYIRGLVVLADVAGLIAMAGPSEDVDVEKIIRRAETLLRGNTHVGAYDMTITTPDWERTIGMKLWTDGTERSFVRITAPTKERGIGFLKIEKEMWQYLPSVERTIKIPPSMMMQSWMGSDFTNDDLVREYSLVDDYTSSYMGTDTVNQVPCHVVDLVPDETAAVVWGRLRMWVASAGYIPVRQDYFDELGELVRCITFDDIRRIGDRTMPTRWTVTPFSDPGNKTVLHLTEGQFDAPINRVVFTRSNLERVR